MEIFKSYIQIFQFIENFRGVFNIVAAAEKAKSESKICLAWTFQLRRVIQRFQCQQPSAKWSIIVCDFVATNLEY